MPPELREHVQHVHHHGECAVRVFGVGFTRETGRVVVFFVLYCIFQKHILQTYNFNKCTALVNFYKTEQSTAVTSTRHFHPHYCSLDILSVYGHSLGTVEMVVCENASRSEVSKILRPTRLAPTTSMSFLPLPDAGLELQQVVVTTFVCMPKCIQLLHLLD